MGIFYTNITLKRTTQKQVVEYLQKNNRHAYVSNVLNDCLVVFDELSEEDSSELRKLSLNLSKEFQCPAFATLVHDDDLFMYWLYKAGKLVDEYNSLPAYFEMDNNPEPPSGGKPNILCDVFQVPDALSELEEIFKRATKAVLDDDYSGDPLIGDEIHDVITQALGIPLFAVDTSFYSLQRGDYPKDLKKESTVYC